MTHPRQFPRAVLVAAITAGFAVAVSACGTSTASGPAVLATDGEEIFSMKALGSEAGCVTCHSLTPEHVIVGPSLAGLGDRAADRVPGLQAAEYVRASILTPDQFVVDGFESGEMPITFGELLTDEQLDALVNYILEVPQ